jgi:hypothetical protein
VGELKAYPRDWHNYLRMNEEISLNLLSLLTPLIKKQDMIMREAATPHERLPATLRFLVNGRSYEDLKYSTSTKMWAHRSHLYHCQSDEIFQKFLFSYISSPEGIYLLNNCFLIGLGIN